MNTVGSERKTNRKVSDRYIFLRTAGLAFALFLTSQSVTAQEVVWPQFRGPDSNPVAANAKLVDRWSKTENVEWSQEIPGRRQRGNVRGEVVGAPGTQLTDPDVELSIPVGDEGHESSVR